jgi:anion-transporting  ArsA/GET3 family ATPase
MTSRSQCEVVICIGAGGVGKTTAASVIGLHFATEGYRTLVITIDPAQRLLDALSLDGQGRHPTEVFLGRFMDNVPAKSKELFAFMPDLKKEWIDFLQASVHNAQLCHEIAANPFYQYMADGLPGAFEIICSHILFRLMNSRVYDKIVLDTPPSSHSVSFFDVPKKVSAVLEQSIFRSLITRRHSFFVKLTKKLAFLSGGLLGNTLERVIGSHFLSEMIDFALTIDALYEPMLIRTKSMEQLLASKDTKYILVCRPTLSSVHDCFSLQEALNKRGLHISELVINQVMPASNRKKIDKEYDLLKAMVGDRENMTTIDYLLSTYQNEVDFEQKLILRLKEKFLRATIHQLPLSETKSKKPKFLSELLHHYREEKL